MCCRRHRHRPGRQQAGPRSIAPSPPSRPATSRPAITGAAGAPRPRPPSTRTSAEAAPVPDRGDQHGRTRARRPGRHARRGSRGTDHRGGRPGHAHRGARRHGSAAPATHAVPAGSGPPRRHRPSEPRRAAGSLPLHYSTGNATRVITVTAPSYGSTTATLQPWVKQSGGGWKKQGSAIARPHRRGRHEHAPQRVALGDADRQLHADPGVRLLQRPGNAAAVLQDDDVGLLDQQPGRLYNTHQRCGRCGYNNGVNEHLCHETPFYNYAVVIDYNTRNAPGGVHAGAGSAFFLHVTDGSATAGCVAIPQSRLVPIMQLARTRNAPAHPHRRQLNASRSRRTPGA